MWSQNCTEAGGPLSLGCCAAQIIAHSLFPIFICLWLTVCWLETPPALQAVRRQRKSLRSWLFCWWEQDFNSETHSLELSWATYICSRTAWISVTSWRRSEYEPKSGTELFRVSKVILKGMKLNPWASDSRLKLIFLLNNWCALIYLPPHFPHIGFCHFQKWRFSSLVGILNSLTSLNIL